VDEGAASLMSAFNSLNGVPASANPFTLNQVLRKEWKFRGLVTSDWTSISELEAHGVANDGPTAARKALTAGVEMDMEANLYHLHLAQMVRSGEVPIAVVDEAVRRVLRVKFALGLFDNPLVDEAKEQAAMLLPESRELTRKAAEESLVLLKNDAGAGSAPLLPLAKSVGKVALVGPLADDAANMIGSWGGQGRAEEAVTLRAALTKELGADRVVYASGGKITASTDEEIAGAVAAAKQADVTILALGEDAGSMTAEAGSRAHLVLPGRQQQLLEAVAGTGKPLVMVLFSGRPLTLGWAFSHVPAVLEAWFPGLEAGPAIARTLFGDNTPSGKLVVSWPRAVGQVPLYYNAQSTGRPAGSVDLTHPPMDGDEKYHSRYVDEQNSPQYPFGYGLSYTTFQYGATTVNAAKLSAGKLKAGLGGSAAVAKVTAEIKNTGSRDADEVVQLYLRLEGTSTAQPVRALKGFQRMHLAAGESRTVTFDLTADALALWDEQNHYTVEPAKVTVWVAPDATRGSSAALTLER
jgi:beta-glucosidase